MTDPDNNIQAVKYHGRPTDGNNCRSAAEQGVYDFLDRLGIDYVTYCHRAAFTMEECAAVRNGLGVPVFKNLFLTNRQQTVFFLLILPADKPFKTKHLSSQLGCARLSFASAEAMEEYLHLTERTGRFWQKYAEGIGTALYEIGNMYRLGTGVPIDLKKAAKYFRLAAENGNIAAENALNNKKFRDFKR